MTFPCNPTTMTNFGQRIDRVRCVSEDILQYNYCNKLWLFNTSKCMLLHPGTTKALTAALTLVFVPQEGPAVTGFGGHIRGNYCFAFYDDTRKISHAKRYRLHCPRGGFVVIDGNCTLFNEATFELLFRVEGPETVYHH